MIMICNSLFNFIKFCIVASFLTKLLTLGILFSTVGKAAFVAKLVILGILPLTTCILALREALVAKLVMSGILSSIFFLIISFFLLHHLVYLNQQELVLSWFLITKTSSDQFGV